MMRRLTLFITLIVILAMVFPAFAGNNPAPAASEELKSYIVFMEGLPAVAYDGTTARYAATKPAAGTKIDLTSEAVQAYTGALTASHDNALAAAGVATDNKIHDYTIAFNGFSALMTAAEAAAIEKAPGVALVLEDEMRYPETDSVGTFLGLDVPTAAYSKYINGENVIVGVIDSGIWPEHPSFADDGSYPDLGIVLDDSRPNCEFGNQAHNPNDLPFECNNKLLGARQMLDTYRALTGVTPDEYDSARDNSGHGTHTASTAAGNYGVPASIYGIDRGMITGVAFRARVIAYKGLGDLGGYTSDLAAAIDQAVADGVDVINYSIGGGAAGPGADEIAFLFAADAGVHVATSAGNSGPGPATLGNPGTMPWMTTVGANTQSRFFQGSASSSDGWEFYGASITPGTMELSLVDGEDATVDGDDRCLPGTLDSGVVAGKIVLCRRGGSARADKSRAVWMAGGAGMIMYNNSDVDNLASDSHWVPSVHIDQTPGLAIKAYIASDADPTAQINGGVSATWPFAPSMTIFSSRGPNPVAPDIIKPDITAPGTQILAGYSPTPTDAYDIPGEYFAAIQGTSMSSPVIAGIFALIDQVHPEWSPAAVKSAIMTTAYQDVLDNDRISPADPFDFGAGHVDPSGKPLGKYTPWNPGLVFDAGLFEYAAFTCGMDWGVFTPGSCDFLASLGIPFDPSDLNQPAIGIAALAGSQTVQRTVTHVGKRGTYRAYVEAPPGYEVTVEPDVLRLTGDVEATFYVTFTNDGTAPVGEWRFGSLTWLGANKVRIPLAVRGELFDAPAAVSDTGTEGDLTFDVSFGYEGTYSAAGHGLEPATVTSDNVVQDPDQTFDPNDGYSNLHQFSLSGAALFRIAIPPEATEADADLDVFVFDPNGVQVATSTSGGTDELVDIVLPMDGTWSVYVHGWASPGGDSDYDMYSWVVSATPGGNLSLDSAPTAAVIGTTETIYISWTGATAGQWHLGAVSHTGDVGLMGLTLVEVDNR